MKVFPDSILREGRIVEEDDNIQKTEYLAEDREKILRDGLQSAMRFLSRRIYTVKELKARLLKAGISQDILPDVIAECHRRRYLGDDTAAMLYFNELRRRCYGPRYIWQYMKQKGLNEDLIKAAFEGSDPEYSESDVAVNAYRIKVRTINKKEIPQKRREKIQRFLYSRGFSSSVIADVIREYENENRKRENL